MKLEKDIYLPFKEITVIGTDYISDDYALTKTLKRVVDQSRSFQYVGKNMNNFEKILFYIAMLCFLLNISSLLFWSYRDVGIVSAIIFAILIGYLLHKKQTR